MLLSPVAGLIALASLACAANSTSSSFSTRSSTLTNTYIVSLLAGASKSLQGRSPDSGHQAFHKRATAASIKYSVNYQYDAPDLLYGLSIKLENDADAAAIRNMPEVQGVWPVRSIARPQAAIPDAHGPQAEHIAAIQPTNRLLKRSDPQHLKPDGNVNHNTPHTMTGVDRLHSLGIKGKGVKVAVLDTGVDYRHVALGGCFGPGCKVSFGYDLVGDAYNGTYGSYPMPDSDPLATCVTGFHGTHTFGIIAMEESVESTFSGMIGVAPEATVGMYRVFGCTGGASDDVLVAAMIRAADDGADVISMSIGEVVPYANISWSPFEQVVTGLTTRGVAVIAAAGNDGAYRPFNTETPGLANDALSVASVENVGFQTFEMLDSLGKTIRYGSLYPFAKGTLTAILVGSGTLASEYGCTTADHAAAAAKVTGDLSKYVLIVRRGYCPVTTIQAYAAAAGFDNVITFPDDTDPNVFIQGYISPAPYLVGNGSAIVNFGSTTSHIILDGVTSGKNYTLKFGTPNTHISDQIWGGQMSNFSSIGPTWDWKFKPQMAAPGGNILSTYPLDAGGWAILSGTSMATPYLAGVYALVKSQNSTLGPKEIFNVMQSTSKPMIMPGRGDISTVAHQGAGLVSAYDAVTYTSRVSPGQLALGPIEELVSEQPEITITNRADWPVTYRLTHTIANGMKYYPHGEELPGNEGWLNLLFCRLEASLFAASMSFEQSYITIPAGQSQQVPLAITPPQGLSPEEIPIYSGFVTVSSSLGGEQFSIPYMGVGYNYTAAASFGHNTPGPSTNVNDNYRDIFSAPTVYYSGGEEVQNYRRFTLESNDFVGVVSTFLQPTSWMRYDLVRADIELTPTWYGFDQNVTYTNLTKTASPDHMVGGIPIIGNILYYQMNIPTFQVYYGWSGLLYDENYYQIGLLKGSYRILIRSIFTGVNVNDTVYNDVTNWQTFLGPIVEITRDVPAV
ncbi:hypothetical protein BP5796_09355 [Coleophoma crateriformis]|uniref:Peptidase S8/S53 domain-containing protein n=1 Tax=Coleophoma crateriformis TaxID=565419 RepID=A0A3D8QXT9_9HELO|nr:hypothetical protein BP5796_09355 [Coleophoma crateriformis]